MRRGLGLALAAVVATGVAAVPALALSVGYSLDPAQPNGANGWYTTPVTVTWHVSEDAVDASCPAVQTLRDDTPGVQLECTVTGPGGSRATATTELLRIDQTPPALGTLSAGAALGAATLRWATPPGAAEVTLTRVRGARSAALPLSAADVAGGRAVDDGLAPGVRYGWVLTVRDAAGNAATATATTLWRPPVLRWHRRRGARYYNVQLFRDGRKILSAWPGRARLALSARWRYRGHRRRLAPGRYRWYVWPGHGPRSARRYGALATSGRFTVH